MKTIRCHQCNETILGDAGYFHYWLKLSHLFEFLHDEGDIADGTMNGALECLLMLKGLAMKQDDENAKRPAYIEPPSIKGVKKS